MTITLTATPRTTMDVTLTISDISLILTIEILIGERPVIGTCRMIHTSQGSTTWMLMVIGQTCRDTVLHGAHESARIGHHIETDIGTMTSRWGSPGFPMSHGVGRHITTADGSIPINDGTGFQVR